MTFLRRAAVAIGLVFAGLNDPAHGVLIGYQFFGTASGTLGLRAFDNDRISIGGTADTEDVEALVDSMFRVTNHVGTGFRIDFGLDEGFGIGEGRFSNETFTFFENATNT